MKKFFAILFSLFFTFFIQGCQQDLEIQGSTHIYINESQPYKVISVSTEDSYKWKVHSKNKDYTLVNDASSEVVFNAQSAGKYRLELKVKKGNETFKTELEIEVTEPEVINGYILPSEPDPTINDSTLLGIDVNSNGVRDDVERKVIKTYQEPIKIELMMARAKVAQKILVNPIGLAIENSNDMSKVTMCLMFLRKQNIKIENSVKTINDYTYTTEERVRAYLEYNAALSGGVYGSSPRDWTSDKCDFDAKGILGGVL